MSTPPPPPTTPPPQPPLLHSTPVHTNSNTTDPCAIKLRNRARIMKQLAHEMPRYMIGPMPPQLFLDTFLPRSESPNVSPKSRSIFEEDMFSAVVGASRESQMHLEFVRFRTSVSGPRRLIQ